MPLEIMSIMDEYSLFHLSAIFVLKFYITIRSTHHYNICNTEE